MKANLALIAAALLLSMAGFLTNASAQDTGGAKGKVRNMNDQGIAGATISARQKGVDLKSTKSDSKGNFVLDGLEPGIYNLAFEAKGYSAAVQYNVEIKKNKIRDLGGRLILMVDRGSRVIIRGSVFFREGRSAPGSTIIVERISSDGSARKVGETAADSLGEFSFSQPEGPAKFRIRASFRGATGFKEIEVDSAMVYRLAVTLDLPHPQK